MNDTFVCPICGADVPHKARACPQCGADEQTGWSNQTYLDGIDMPGDESYSELVEKEFGAGGVKRTPWQIIVAVIACILLGIFLVATLW